MPYKEYAVGLKHAAFPSPIYSLRSPVNNPAHNTDVFDIYGLFHGHDYYGALADYILIGGKVRSSPWKWLRAYSRVKYRGESGRLRAAIRCLFHERSMMVTSAFSLVDGFLFSSTLNSAPPYCVRPSWCRATRRVCGGRAGST